MFKRPFLTFILLIMIAAPIAWFGYLTFEGEKPTVAVYPDVSHVGKDNEFTVTIKDSRSGVRKVVVTLQQGTNTATIIEKIFPRISWLKGGEQKEATLSVKFSPKKLNINDGTAKLIFTVWDYSLREWFHGNRVIVDKQVVVDTVPPVVSVVSNTRYLYEGGAGVVCYSTTEKVSRSGILVGETFFPGVPLDERERLYLAYFAVPRDQSEVKMMVIVQDTGGNEARSSFFHSIKEKTFRHDTIKLPESFLELIASRFRDSTSEANADNLAVFINVNTVIREKNRKQVKEICRHSQPGKLWAGVFHALPNAAARARFADSRTYIYDGKKVSSSVHYGLDLASIANSPIPAGNSGVVVYADYLGIYGNTILIDHGQGLFSMYAHLSTFNVQSGDTVEKGQTLGLTGYTGLAGGDHLHFGMYVWGEPVNPVEWLDPNWVEKKIEQPLNAIMQRQSSAK